jgi:hypothetical protein
MSIRVFEYLAGTPATEEDAIAFVALASAGDPSARSRLVYPGSPPALNPVTYFTNPDRRLGFDNDDVINAPANTLVETADDQVLVSFGHSIVDRIVVERWTVGGSKLSMSAAFYRELRNYHENPPDPEVDGYLQWSPANQSTKTFEVQLVTLQVGADLKNPDATEFRPIGGDGTNAGPDGDLGVEFASAGWLDAEVVQTLRIVSEV